MTTNHIVCHDCEFEHVVEDDVTGHAAAMAHEIDTAGRHDVECVTIVERGDGR